VEFQCVQIFLLFFPILMYFVNERHEVERETNVLTLKVAAVFHPRNPCGSHRYTFETGSSNNRPGCWFLVWEDWV
jgi:hypothetical protein